MVLTRIKFPPLNISWSNYEGFLFTSCQAFCVCLYMCFCVSGSLISWISFSLPLSALVSPVPDPEEALAGIWKHTRAHTKNTHTHTDQCLGSPIEIRSLSKGLYPGIPDITERQKICMKRETPYRALSVCVCVRMCWCICSNTTPRHSEWEPTPSLSRALSRWSQLWRGSRLLPASHRAYKWIYYHSLFIPTILLGMSLARLCNERVHSRVLF